MRLFAPLTLSIAASCALLAACSGSASRSSASADGAAATSQAIACDTGATCTAAQVLGAVSGDTADAGLEASGTTSAWIHVRVTEDNSDWSGHPVHLRASLTSPAGAEFELHAYLDTSRNVDAGLDCRDEVGAAVATASGSSLDIAWGDPPDASANGVDDGRTVALEVRHISGDCNAGASWHLAMHGGP
jgi:hypothetical protein